jgi:riboflavin synthase
MFTGIIETTGLIRGIEELETTRRFTVEANDLPGTLAPGDSVAVDGACLTAVTVGEGHFAVDVIGTTLEKTVAGRYGEGARVNLERALRFQDRLNGHLVQGHVDGVGHLIQSVKEGEYWMLDFSVPREVVTATIRHGSIALNGVSLTVAELLGEDTLRIGIIPFTHEHTNLGDLAPGDPVNVEGDLIGKYVGKMLATRGSDSVVNPNTPED